MSKYLKLSPKLLSALAILHDVSATMLAWWLAFALRFNFQIPEEFVHSIVKNGYWVIPLQVIVFFYFGLYKGVWRFASLPDLKRILKAAMTSVLLMLVVRVMLLPHGVIPRSVYFLDPILLIMLMGGSRFVYRAWKDHDLYAMHATMGEPVLVLGAGDVAINLLNDLARSTEWRVVGLLDNEKHLHHRELKGVRVLGSIDDLAHYAKAANVQHVIVAFANTQNTLKRRAIQLAKNLNLNILTVPTLDDLMSGKVKVSQIRKVDIEDLLGRDPVQLDEQGLHDLMTGQVVMVTGAGGSIGSELCRQIRAFQPRVLVCYDVSEYALYTLEQELANLQIKTRMVYVVGDVKNAVRVKALLNKYLPTIVFHAAAYKHVPMMENDNVSEALNNNVVGTYAVASACQDTKVKRFVLVSTDKAVNPTNVMGASKRLAEMVCQGLQNAIGNETTYAIVRFGNVLGSSGSVIPKFKQQISSGGPVTVTHPEITRYFMSIPEACQLVMQAGSMGKKGEIFVLDMGESVKIADLAREMIRLSGFQESEIGIQYTGLRPGEKLYEELLADDEKTTATPHPKLKVAVARDVELIWVQSMLSWISQAYSLDEHEIKAQLKLWVEEYTIDHQNRQPIEKIAVLSQQSQSVH